MSNWGFSVQLFLVLCCSLRVEAAQEFAFQETQILAEPCHEPELCFDVSAAVSTKSSWTSNEVLKRLQIANTVLSSCGLKIQRVHLMRWTPSQAKLRLDETELKSPHFDGLWEAARKGHLATPLRLFYFEDYQEPFTYGGSVPLAVYQDEDFATHLHHTAWFPYQSAQRRLNGENPAYSEEAHELGHLLLKAGHDHSGEANIMANNSEKRAAHFSPSQCKNLLVPGPLSKSWFAESHSAAWSTFRIFQSTYGSSFYMNDWCARNSQNFLRTLLRSAVINEQDATLLLMRPRQPLTNFSPLRARHPGPAPWKYHAVALVGDRVYDLDLKDQAEPLSLPLYLEVMWGAESVEQMEFLRWPLAQGELTEFTALRILALFEANPTLVESFEDQSPFMTVHRE